MAAVSGLLLSSPVFFVQLWLFVAPGLYENERKIPSFLILASSVLFLVGAFCLLGSHSAEFKFPFRFPDRKPEAFVWGRALFFLFNQNGFSNWIIV